MKLHRPDVLHLHARCESLPIVSYCRTFFGSRPVVRVTVVNETAVRNPSEEPAAAANLQLAPAHMWNFEYSFESGHVAREQCEPGNLRRFVTRFVERLETQTDPQERRAAGQQVAKRLQKPALLEGSHHRAEVTLTRENDLLGGAEQLRPVHHLGRVSEVLNGLQHRANIAGAVVE